MLGRHRRTPYRLHRHLVGARRAPQPEIDAAREEARQRAELLRDDVRRMVRQHDAAGAHPDGLRPGRDVRDDDRRGGAGDASHVVMLGHPDAPVAPALGVGREVARVVQSGRLVGLLGDANELEQGQRRHRRLAGNTHTQADASAAREVTG